MLMPGRKYPAVGGVYRYGFNGKENDNEVKGEGNQQDYGMRIYDPRLVKFVSVDPLSNQFPWNSVYSYAEGDPVNYIDLDGCEKPPIRAQAVPVLKRPIIEPVHSEAPPQALQQAKQRAMSLSPILTPEQKKAKDMAAITKQLQTNQATLNQGGLLGSYEYKIAKGRYDLYGQYLPGPSDIVDGLTALDELSKGNYKSAAAAGFFLIPGADFFKPIKSLKGLGGEALEGYIKKFGNQADHLVSGWLFHTSLK
jgi:RHS repeat-associated protein